MEKDVQIGPEAVLKMSVSGGKVRIELDYAGKQLNAGTFVEPSIDEFAALLKNAIPGQIDDMVIDGLVGALKMIP